MMAVPSNIHSSSLRDSSKAIQSVPREPSCQLAEKRKLDNIKKK